MKRNERCANISAYEKRKRNENEFLDFHCFCSAKLVVCVRMQKSYRLSVEMRFSSVQTIVFKRNKITQTLNVNVLSFGFVSFLFYSLFVFFSDRNEFNKKLPRNWTRRTRSRASNSNNCSQVIVSMQNNTDSIVASGTLTHMLAQCAYIHSKTSCRQEVVMALERRQTSVESARPTRVWTTMATTMMMMMMSLLAISLFAQRTFCSSMKIQSRRVSLALKR